MNELYPRDQTHIEQEPAPDTSRRLGETAVSSTETGESQTLEHLSPEDSRQLVGAIVHIHDLGPGRITHVDTEAGCALIKLYGTQEEPHQIALLHEITISTDYLDS